MHPGAIDASASAVAARALAIDEVAGAITSVSLAGLEPRTLGRTVAALERSTKLARRASGITGAQGPALRKRAALARLADAGGGTTWKPKPWDPAQWINKLHGETVHAYKVILEDEERVMKNLLGARDLHGRKLKLGMGRSAAYRLKFASWQDMRRHYWGERGLRYQRLDLLRKVAASDWKSRMAAAGKANWEKIKPPKKNSIFSKIGKKLAPLKRVGARAIGPAIAIGTSIYKGEPISTTGKRVLAAVAAEAAAVAIQVVGGAACAALVAGTAGVGALACPAIVGVSAAGAAIAVNAIGNHQIDQAEAERKRRQQPPPPPPRPRPAGPALVVPVPRVRH